MIKACTLVLAGGIAAQHSRLPFSSDICILLLVASLLMLVSRRTFFAGCLLFGASWFLLAGKQIVDDRLLQRYAGDSMLVDVRIVDFPKRAGNSVLMMVEPVDDPRLPQRSRVSWYEPAVSPSLGDLWRLELRLKRPRGLSNPGVFDRETWLFRNKIHATGYVVEGERNRRLETGTGSTLQTFRQRFVSRAAELAPSPETGSVLAAIGVGARHRVSRAQWDRYAISGTSHLMAISGLHIGLAASAAFLMARCSTSLLPLAVNTHLLSLLAAVVCAAAYAIVSGLGVPAQRATLMLLILAFTVLRRRQTGFLETIALAACLVFVANPVTAMAPGFHLSFSAVLLLFWLSCVRQTGFERRPFFSRAAGRIRQLFTVQAALLFGLMPLTILLFQRIAWLALPTNLAAVPLFSFVTVPLTLLGLALGDTVGFAADAALMVAACSVEILESLIARVASLPGADSKIVGIQGYRWLVVALPALFAVLPKGWPGRYVAVLAVVSLLTQSATRPPRDCVDVYVLDVGQGLSTVLQTHSKTLIFDTAAAYRGGGSVAKQVVVPFLESRGVKRIDWLLVSHADIDHSGGVSALFEAMRIEQLLVGETLPRSAPSASLCGAGQAWGADGVRFRIVHPGATSPRDGNDSSCVLLVEAGRHSVLLTGDIEAPAERAIVEEWTGPGVDAVLVPHHGSLTSSSVGFVSAMQPRLAVVSSGFENRWGFPKADVVARWEAAGARLLNTATSGAVSFRICSDGGLGTVREERRERRRFWQYDEL